MGRKVNLIVDQGSTFESTITLTDSNNQLINLTGYSATGQLRKHYTSSNAVSFSVTLGGANGTLTLGLSSNATANIVAGRYVYDVELTYPSNNVSRVIEGIVTVTPQVTR